MTAKRIIPWIVFLTFVAAAIIFNGGEPRFISNGPYAAGKIIMWIAFFAFWGYSAYCASKENIFKTIKQLLPFHWARQIGIDLYIGMALSMCIIYLNEGSLLVLALWFVPLVLFANLATLLYVALNYDSLLSHFLM